MSSSLLHGCIVCGFPTNKMCSGCNLVSYCQHECQKLHWKTHKKKCKPLTFPTIKINSKTDEFIGETIVSSFSSVFLIDCSGNKIGTNPPSNDDLSISCSALIRAAIGRGWDHRSHIKVAFTALLDNRILYIGHTEYNKDTHVCVLDLRLRTLKYAFKCKAEVAVYPLDGRWDARLLLAGTGKAELWDPITKTITLTSYENLLYIARSSEPGWAFLFFDVRTEYCSLVALAGRRLPSVDAGCQNAEALNTTLNVWPGIAKPTIMEYERYRTELKRIELPITNESISIPITAETGSHGPCITGNKPGYLLLRSKAHVCYQITVTPTKLIIQEIGMYGILKLDGRIVYSHCLHTETGISVCGGSNCYSGADYPLNHNGYFCPGGRGLYSIEYTYKKHIAFRQIRDAEGRCSISSTDSVELKRSQLCKDCSSHQLSMLGQVWLQQWLVAGHHQPFSEGPYIILDLFSADLKRHIWSLHLAESYTVHDRANAIFCGTDLRALDTELLWCPGPLIDIIVEYLLS